MEEGRVFLESFGRRRTAVNSVNISCFAYIYIYNLWIPSLCFVSVCTAEVFFSVEVLRVLNNQ